MKDDLDCQSARLAPVELKRGQKVHVFEALDAPAGQHGQARFGEGLDAHDSWKHRCSVDLVIVQEGLNRRIQCRLDGEAMTQSYSRGLSERWTFDRQRRG